MTGNELWQEISAVKDNLLDSQVSTAVSGDSITAKLQREADLLRDGLSSGLVERAEEAKENLGATTLEVAGSFAIGGGLAWMAKAGGRWGTTAKAAGGLFTILMASDVTRRAIPTWGAMADTWNSEVNLSQNKQIVGHYAGSALFDYPVMLGSGLAGAASVHFAPKALEIFKSRETTYPGNVLDMNLGENGARLGAKEKGALDPLANVRERLAKPHQKTMQLGDLADVLEAKRLAAHPEIAPLRGTMLETLGEIDALRPELTRNKSALTNAEKQLGELTGMKAEGKALEAAERHLATLKSEQNELGQMRARDARLQAELRPGAKDARDSAVVRQELLELRQDIASTRRRVDGLQQADAAVTRMKGEMATRRSAIEAGQAKDVQALDQQVRALRETIATQEAQLGLLSTKLQMLDQQFIARTTEVRPTLNTEDMPPSVPDLVRVKPTEQVRVADVRTGNSPAVKPTEVTKPADVVPAKVLEKPIEVVAEKPADVKPTDTSSGRPATEVKPADKPVTGTTRGDEPTVVRAEKPAPKPEQRQPEGDRPRQERPTDRGGKVGEREVADALRDANRAVNDFATTGARHTTALKGVTEYINRAFEWFANDPQAPAVHSAEVLANVQAMLGKIKNWERPAGWVPRAERAQIMDRNGFTADQMGRFDEWATSLQSNYQARANQVPDATLADIRTHLENRVKIESVKSYLKKNPDTEAAVSPIVQEGFNTVRSGRLPDGTPIHPDSDLIVFEKKTIRGADGQPTEVIVPYAKDGVHIQRFDVRHIENGIAKQEAMKTEGPQGVAPDDLYGFRLDHDPGRLVGARNQVGFAILRPGGAYGKNIAYMKFTDAIDAASLPKQLRADVVGGPPGTNTGSLYNMLRSMGTGQRGPGGSGGIIRPDTPISGAQRSEKDKLPNLEIQ